MNAGSMQFTSMYSPTSCVCVGGGEEVMGQAVHNPLHYRQINQFTLSNNRVAVLGGLHSTLCFTQSSSRKCWNSGAKMVATPLVYHWYRADRPTMCMEADGRGECDSKLFLQFRNHIDSLERWGEVHFPHLLWVIFHWVVPNLVSTMNLINHAFGREGQSGLKLHTDAVSICSPASSSSVIFIRSL